MKPTIDERLWAAPAGDTDPDLHDFVLERLVELAIREAATKEPDERRALSMAVYSTFLDCMDLGLAQQAYRVFAFFHPRVSMSRVDMDDVAG